MKCVLCAGEGHHWTKCPLFGTTKEYLAAKAPLPLSPEEMGEVTAKRRASLAPSLIGVFGKDTDGALQSILDSNDADQEHKTLALELLIGTKKMDQLDDHDNQVLNDMTFRLLTGPKPAIPDPEHNEPLKPSSDTNKGSEQFNSVNYDPDRSMEYGF